MDLLAPCSSCTSLYRQPSLHRQITSPKTSTRSLNSLKCRRITASSELQTPVGVTSNSGIYSPSIPTHKVTVHDRQRGVVHEFVVPEDQYILHTAEAQNIYLPFACRHGCCTSCAVRIKSGQISQPEALGISAELKSKACFVTLSINVLQNTAESGCFIQFRRQLHYFTLRQCLGYALLCVGFPSSDVEVETQDEDEVYWLQFGRYFARGPIERDDYALELALGDE
ncbi:hypothetical protein Pint_03411 [Pistacia integerrima]|uniref:Uncharacterized protein n=1 Tax=Pistacia integerrima TaxID=434235 RepID=A0ACC0ZIM9_9ROSI|nr:hypothetical protein Pint_03411 [Pistacia integerrima]